MIDFFNLTALLAAICLTIGFVYRYIIIKATFEFRDLLTYLVAGIMTAFSISYVVGYFDYLFYDATLIGFNETYLKLPALVGTFVMLCYFVNTFINNLKSRR